MKKWWIFPFVLVVAVTTIALTRSKQSAPVTVRTTVLRPQRIEKTLSCNGVIEAGELVAVLAPQTCIADEVLVEVGQRVAQGDILITVDKEASKRLQSADDRVADALPLTTMGKSIVATQSGIVVSVEASDGMILDSTEPCVVIAADSGLQVRVMIREKQLPDLQVGQEVRISGAGFDKSVYYGRLSEISSAVSETSGGEGIVEGVISLNDGETDTSMRLGLSAKAKVVVSSTDDALLVPYEAIVDADDGEQFVYFVQDGRVKRETIDPQGDYGGGVLVSRSDWDGRSLVLEPNKITSDGQSVKQTRGAE